MAGVVFAQVPGTVDPAIPESLPLPAPQPGTVALPPQILPGEKPPHAMPITDEGPHRWGPHGGEHCRTAPVCNCVCGGPSPPPPSFGPAFMGPQPVFDMYPPPMPGAFPPGVAAAVAAAGAGPKPPTMNIAAPISGFPGPFPGASVGVPPNFAPPSNARDKLLSTANNVFAPSAMPPASAFAPQAQARMPRI